MFGVTKKQDFPFDEAFWKGQCLQAKREMDSFLNEMFQYYYDEPKNEEILLGKLREIGVENLKSQYLIYGLRIGRGESVWSKKLPEGYPELPQEAREVLEEIIAAYPAKFQRYLENGWKMPWKPGMKLPGMK